LWKVFGSVLMRLPTCVESAERKKGENEIRYDPDKETASVISAH
jgi:hypothetical protein